MSFPALPVDAPVWLWVVAAILLFLGGVAAPIASIRKASQEAKAQVDASINKLISDTMESEARFRGDLMGQLEAQNRTISMLQTRDMETQARLIQCEEHCRKCDVELEAALRKHDELERQLFLLKNGDAYNA